MDYLLKTVGALVEEMAAGVVLAPGSEDNDFAWVSAEYRDSPEAALSSRSGPVRLDSAARAALERAVVEIWTLPDFQIRWTSDERWPVLATLAVAARDEEVSARKSFIEERLEKLVDSGPSFAMQMIANVSWSGPPQQIGDLVVGVVNQDLFNMVDQLAGGRRVPTLPERMRWLNMFVWPRVDPSVNTRPAAICCWTVGQMQRANDEVDRHLRNIVDLPVLLGRDVQRYAAPRRDAINRPGVRGLTLDHSAVANALQAGPFGLEFAAFPLIATAAVETGDPYHFYEPRPLPLSEIYRSAQFVEKIEKCLADTIVANRIRLAARWFAEASLQRAATR